MQNGPTQIIKGVIQKRIALLADIIATGNEESAALAAIQLAFIGTKESADTLMQLIEKKVSLMCQEDLIAALSICSPFRDQYKERLLQIERHKEHVISMYSDAKAYDQNLFAPPLWQEIAEACASEFTRKLGAINDRGPSD